MTDIEIAQAILQGDDTDADILQALGLELLGEVKRLRQQVGFLKQELEWEQEEE